MFFIRSRFFILCHPVNHSRMSFTARREVVAATPTTQTTVVVLDMFRFVASRIVIGCCVLNFVISLLI
jgi:hypothetical protein